ncbi:MAG: ABC transporter permease [Saprospiraceae bacterium]|nr:ABC transporter permease [Saprospiraceae bacterium]
MPIPDHPTPPRWPLTLLRFFIRDQYLEEIEGDLEEVYFEFAEVHTERRARWLYTLEVIRLFRPNLIKKLLSPSHHIHLDMFKHNLTISLRSYWRQKSSFLINLIGLSTGLACFLLITLWIKDELAMDKFHANDAQLYQVMEQVTSPNSIGTTTNTAGPVAATLVEELPEVLAGVTARTKSINPNTLSVGDVNLKAKGLYATEDLFRLFSFELLAGSPDQALADPNSIVLSESLAKRLFEQASAATGQSLELAHESALTVTGVFKDTPAASSLQFDYVLPFRSWSQENTWVNEWRNSHPQAFLLLDESADIDQLNEKIAGYIGQKTEGEDSHRQLFVRKYSDNYLYGGFENGVQSGGRIEYVRLFSLIALFILMIACINFMNLSTARATRRLKEIGVKKSLGATRGSLISQYISESTLLAFLSCIVALGIVWVALPQFNLITNKELHISFDAFTIGFLLLTIIGTGLLAGSYPALYLSGLKPILIIKGTLKSSWGELLVRKGLVVVQFALSVILIVSVWVVYQQIQYTQDKHLGYNRDNVLLIEKEGKMETPEAAQTFLAEMERIPGVQGAASLDNTMTHSDWRTNGVEWPGKDPADRTAFEVIQVDYDAIELLDMEMAAGRTFSRAFGSDTTAIIFNEAAIKHMGLEDPVGMQLDMWGGSPEIIGVVKDFHFESLHEVVDPLIMYLGDHGRYMMVRVDGQRTNATISAIRNLYQTSNPGFALDYQFLDDEYAALYAAENRVSTLSRYFAGLAVLISCLGLFGLAMFSAAQRRKEIGIRKVLGATYFQLIRLLSLDFTRMVGIAILIGLPISYYLLKNWLSSFAFRIDLQWYYFIGAGLLSLLIAWLTVLLQMTQATRVNPVESLRNE